MISTFGYLAIMRKCKTYNQRPKLLNKNEKLHKSFKFKDLGSQKDLSVIELHTQYQYEKKTIPLVKKKDK